MEVRERHTSFTGIGSMLFNSPGYNRETSSICWEAPIAILIYLDEKPVFGIGLEFYTNRLSIRQLQGSPGANIPADLPKICVSGAIKFAKDTGIEEIRLYRAHKSLFYRDSLFETPEGESRQEIQKAIRKRMRRRYDGTARQLGFTMKKDWGELCTKK